MSARHVPPRPPAEPLQLESKGCQEGRGFPWPRHCCTDLKLLVGSGHPGPKWPIGQMFSVPCAFGCNF